MPVVAVTVVKDPAALVVPPITVLLIVPATIVGAIGDANLAVVTIPLPNWSVLKGMSVGALPM
tara:strand:- start:216 stop:404 length:189 start_codon:yes stop_codon:yes gene_type:complete